MRPDKTIARFATGEPATIVALGDSLTRGWMVRKGYLEFMDEMLRAKYPSANFSIINQGIPGDTSDGGLERLGDDVIDHDPHCVFLQFALNDAFIGINPSVYKNTMRAMIDTLRADTDAEIILITSVYIQNSRENDMAERFYDRLAELADECSLPIARVHDYWKKMIREGADFRKLVQYDGVHPTVEGYRLMAEAIMEIF
ncbi:MAG TPA: GDSL-type esterase/lipase family protein [Spirochaetota bacterium]|nr:GDSL-type esterase/lipase family protein [Spirochaetota bacterium]